MNNILTEIQANDAYEFFAQVKLLGLEGHYIRVSANDQRRAFSNVPFGKCRFKVEEGGRVSAFRKVAFGQDWNEHHANYSPYHKGWIQYHDDRSLVYDLHPIMEWKCKVIQKAL